MFPQGRIGTDNPALGRLQADLCFSFSGLKTSLLTHLRRHPLASEAQRDALAAAYQEAIVRAWLRGANGPCTRCIRALAVGGACR